MSNQSEFFIAGGTLGTSVPSYVVRPADGVLLDSLRDHAFCYVLTARQMGKSSLMIRTASQLGHDGAQTALIDLSSIGAAAAEAWYPSLLAVLQHELHLRVNVASWWREQHALSPSQLFVNFVRDVLLTQISGEVVVFIDEIDTMLRLDFRDDFFAAIRAIYNARASEPIYKRLTFVLLGVATPLDLIRDPRLTPFNIGQRIGLQEFTYEDLAPLRRGLEARHGGQADRILLRIYYWTNGHPYLTQKLCLAAAQSTHKGWTDAQVDQLVTEQFLGASGASDTNLNFVRKSIASSPSTERQQMWQIYQAVYCGDVVTQDESSQAQNHLELFGLVRVERGKLVVRNEIYRRVFKPEGMQALGISIPIPQPSPARRLNIVLWASTVAVIVAAILLGRNVAANIIGGPASTAIAVIDTPSPPKTTAVPGITDVPTEKPSITNVPSVTEAPTPTNTPTFVPTPPETPTSTPIALSTPTSTIVGAICIVRVEASVRSRPDVTAPLIVSLKPSNTFTPLARSPGLLSNAWVLVPESSSGTALGWVYAGRDLGLVICANLEVVPVRSG